MPRQPENPPINSTPKSTHIPSFPVLTILLLILYVSITCDVIYVIGVKIYNTKHPNRRPVIQKRISCIKSRPPVPKRNNSLTLDHLWKKITAEARRMKKINASHRDVTFNMMQTRIQARKEERRSGFLKQSSKNSQASVSFSSSQSIDIVRWANRITTDLQSRPSVG